jgi:hypothetical protein
MILRNGNYRLYGSQFLAYARLLVELRPSFHLYDLPKLTIKTKTHLMAAVGTTTL